MLEMCASRRAEQTKETKHDLFSSLLDASDGEADGSAKLTDRELLGRSCTHFISAVLSSSIVFEQATFSCSCLLVTRRVYWRRATGVSLANSRTGPQTTAHTLCFTFGLLAFHQDEQEKLYQHIKSVLKDGRQPVRDSLSSFTSVEHLTFLPRHTRIWEP